MALYAAYGSNMDPQQMLQRAPFSPHQGTGWLQGWRLTFGGADIGWEGALATIVEDENSNTFVSLYDLHERDEAALDEWEGVSINLYSKIRVRIQTLNGEESAFVYVLNDFEGGYPSTRYLSIMVEAVIAAGAPYDYVLDLERRRTNDS